MPRAVWNGAISFGLVTIPVKLYNAVSRKAVRFNQIDERTTARVKYQKVSADTGEEVPSEHIVRAWEFAKGQYVVVDDDELAALAPKGGKAISIEAFVPLDQIDPVLWDSSHYAAPDPGFEKAYALLLRALERSGRVAVAEFVRGGKQYLAAIRPNAGKLDVCTMVWADEVVEADAIEGLDAVSDVEISDAELAMADQLIEQLIGDFDHDAYHDTYREEVVALLQRKAAGEEIVAPTATAAEDDKVVDLLAALEASVAAAKASRAGDEADDGNQAAPAEPETARAEKPAAKKRATKKRSAKKAAAKRAAARKAS
ncbi:MAG: Ku protein [Actinomycetota bacterium]